MKPNEYTEFEGNYYVNPQVSLDEQTEFLGRLERAKNASNERIQAETHALGTDVPYTEGGLTGAEATFAARYQDPQVNAMISDLRAAAQGQALNTTLSNLLAQEKKRYNEAYRRSKNTPTTPSTTGGDGEVEEVEPTGYTAQSEAVGSKALAGTTTVTVPSASGVGLEYQYYDSSDMGAGPITRTDAAGNKVKLGWITPEQAGWTLVKTTNAPFGGITYTYRKDGNTKIITKDNADVKPVVMKGGIFR